MTEQNTLSISELEQQANAGDANAQFNLAVCYARDKHSIDFFIPEAPIFDITFPQGQPEANSTLYFEWLKKAAEQNHCYAQYLLGSYHLSRDSELRDLTVGFDLFKKAAEQGVAAAQCSIAHRARHCKNEEFEIDLAWLIKKIDQTSAQIQSNQFEHAPIYSVVQSYLVIGNLYAEGRVTEKNDVIAFNCYKKAVALNSVVEQNPDKYKYDLNARDQLMLAEHQLALCYLEGKGVGQSFDDAVKWLEKMIADIVDTEFGSENKVFIIAAEVYFLLKELYAQGRKGVDCNQDSVQDFILSIEYVLDSIDAGYAFPENYTDSQYQLALRYFEGKGFEKNYGRGMKWLTKSILANHAEACQWLENTYLNFVFPYFSGREDIAQCYKFAFEWLLNGHGQTPKDFEINFGLAVLYAFGKGVEKNQELAIKHFKACMDETHRIYGSDVSEEFTEIFYNFSDLYKDLSEKTVERYYFDVLAPFFREGKSITGNAKQSNAVLSSLRLEFHVQMREFELLREFLNSFERLESIFKYPYSATNFKNMGLTVTKQAEDLEEKNKALESEIKQKENANHRMQKLVEQFTHSLGNVIFPDTIYQVAERLKNNPECRKDVLLLHEAYHSEIIIKLQGELLRQRYTNTNPEKFRQFIRSCRRTPNSAENTKSIEDILDYAASRVTARFLNQHYAGLNSIRDKMLSKKNLSLDALKQKFEDDILLNKSLRPIAWVNQNLRPVQITELSPLWKKVFILSESHAEALLFGYFSEILFNAFKYADHDKDEFLRLDFDEKTINDKTYLTCSWLNPVKDKSPAMLGTGKGLDAIQEDLKQLNDTENPEESLLISQQNNQFQVTLFFKKDLLVNDLPSLKIKRKANVE